MLSRGRRGYAPPTTGLRRMHLSEVPSLPLHSDAFWCDTLAGSLGYFAILDPRVFGATPLDRWLGSGHPQGVLPSPLFIMS